MTPKEEQDEKNLMSWEEFGNRKVVRKHDPRQPSQQEKEEHEMTHLPFGSWCRHCIMARGREEDCRKVDGGRAASSGSALVLHVHGRREGREDVGILGCKRKGDESCAQFRTREWICRRLMAWLREIGLESVDIIVNSNNEPALTSLIASWSTMRAMTTGSTMIIESRPVGSSKSNGVVARATQSVQGDDQDDSQRHRRTMESED